MERSTVSKWDCPKCPSTLTVLVPVSAVPTHHCPSPKASRVVEYRFVEGYPVQKKSRSRVVRRKAVG